MGRFSVCEIVTQKRFPTSTSPPVNFGGEMIWETISISLNVDRSNLRGFSRDMSKEKPTVEEPWFFF
jgi:hypothetical protein